VISPDVDDVYTALCDQPNAVIWRMALTGEILEVSDSIEAVRGITPEEARAQGPDEIHPPSSLAVSLGYFERFSRDLIEGRVPAPFHADLEYYTRDGSTVWCEVLALPELDDAGQVTALRGVSVPLAEPRDAAAER
jgi:PAS domain S-box-containing protein